MLCDAGAADFAKKFSGPLGIIGCCKLSVCSLRGVEDKIEVDAVVDDEGVDGGGRDARGGNSESTVKHEFKVPYAPKLKCDKISINI